MSDQDRLWREKSPFRGLAEFFDVYVITQGATIRRTALPWNFWAFAVWLMEPYTDIEPEFFDESACREADRSHCGYAEALHNVIDRLLDESMSAKFLIQVRNKPDWAKRERAFIKEQERREILWREAHDEWRKDLPPDLT